MGTNVSVFNRAEVSEYQQYLAGLRDERLKRNGCSVATRIAFYERRIANCANVKPR